MPRAPLFALSLVLLPAFAGILASAWRFRAHDPLAGTACAIGGVLGMLLVIRFLPGASAR